MRYTPIIGTLGFILSPDKKKTLMVKRNSRKEDDHFGKYNGLGGKMEPDEDVMSCMQREIREEAGIECKDMVLRGTVNWTGFGKKGENWLGFIFRIDSFTGTPNKSCPEGPLEWMPIEAIPSLPMWEGDRYFLPFVFENDPRPFHAYMPYDNERCLSFSYHRL